MGEVSRTLSENEVTPTGDTSSIVNAEIDDGGQQIVSLRSARQARANNDLHRWVSSVLPAIDEFLRLPVGWDTYAGKPVQLDTGMFALQLLYDVMNPRIPVPLVAPTSSGGIQFEWRQGPLELELCVNAPYDCELSFRDALTGAEEAYNLSSDFSALTRLMLKFQVQRVAA